MESDLNRLYKVIDYTFNDVSLVKQALTHRSKGADNNERLEFLGDSILNFVIANELFRLYPSLTEGELSRLRAILVKGETLAEIAKEIKLGNFVLLGQGELKSGGFRRESILADAFEALIAAIYLDKDLSQATAFIIAKFDSRLRDKALHECTKDPKTQLQEWLQSHKHPLPVYELVDAKGEQHNQTFYIECQVEGFDIRVTGIGSNRRKAEKDAAIKFLAAVKK